MAEFSSAPDLIAFLEETAKSIGDELELSQINPGDRLIVRTRNTRYLFAMSSAHTATLTSNRPDRPSGQVQINGCVFGGSSLIKPDHLFCGGNLEIAYEKGGRKFTTSPVEAILLVANTSPSPASP